MTTDANVDWYLGSLPADASAALQNLRETVASAAPGAEEAFSDGLPAFRIGERPLVAYGAANGHCTFQPLSRDVIAAHSGELARFSTSKGTIRFAADDPLPPALVRKLVWARIAELRAGR